MKKYTFTLLLILHFLVSGCVFSLPDHSRTQPLVETRIGGEGADKILVMEISGAITQEDQVQNLQGKRKINPVAQTKEKLGMALADPDIRAIILLINSPGGEVTASDILYHELMTFKQRKGIPIVTSITSVGASGAYYVAMASNKVVAHPTSIVGSIGVIINSMNVTRLMEKIGVEDVTYKSGKYKDMGSPLKPVSEEETEIFESIVNHFHNQFVDVVAKGRNMERREVEKLATGRIFNAADARQKGLVDEIGYIDTAIETAKREARLTAASIIMYHRQDVYRENIYNRNASMSSNFLGFEFSDLVSKQNPDFLYLWKP